MPCRYIPSEEETTFILREFQRTESARAVLAAMQEARARDNLTLHPPACYKTICDLALQLRAAQQALEQQKQALQQQINEEIARSINTIVEGLRN